MEKISKENLMILVAALEKLNHQFPVKADIDSEVYGWCQAQAMDLGSYIEAVYGSTPESEAVVHALEDYCENIYLMSQISTVEDRRIVSNDIQKSLGTLRDFVQNMEDSAD